MGKLSQYAPNAQWDTRMADVINKTIRLDSADKLQLDLGFGYACTGAILDDNNNELTRIKILISGKAAVEKLDKYLEATNGRNDQFPFTAVVLQLVSKGGRKYYVLVDPDEVVDFVQE